MKISLWHSSLGRIPVIDFDRREYLKEIVMAQMEVVFRLQEVVQLRFFWQQGAHNFRVAGQWLYYIPHTPLLGHLGLLATHGLRMSEEMFCSSVIEVGI